MNIKFRSHEVPQRAFTVNFANSLVEEEQQRRQEKKKSGKNAALKIAGISGAIIILIVILAIGGKVVASSSNLLSALGEGNLFIKIKHLISPPDQTISGENEDRINILLFGIGGKGHEGELLTDSIILASMRPSTKEAAFVSIPRDLYVQIPGYGMRRINNAYSLGQMSKDQNGGALAVKTVENIFNIPIQFYIRVDFEGSIKAIDAIGGITVNVGEKLVDPYFPVSENGGVRTLIFEKGPQFMDGSAALNYARSRQSTSDFSRSRRQQEIIQAVKEKLERFDFLEKTIQADRLISILNEHVETNIQPWQIVRLISLVEEINPNRIIYKVIDDSEDGPLKSMRGADGAYYLVTKSGAYDELREIAISVFENTEIVTEQARIIIENGTKSHGLARTIGNILKAKNFNIVEMENAAELNHETTLIYDLSLGEKEKTMNALAETLNAAPGRFIPEEILEKKDRADLVVIVGADKIPSGSLSTY